MMTKRLNQLMSWIVAISLLLILGACSSVSSSDATTMAQDKATIAAISTAITEEENEPSTTSTALPPTILLSSLETATVTPTNTPLPPTATVTPTSAPEGIILFLSSRDHPRTQEEIRDHSGAHDLELYAMRPDGSQQTRLSDGTLELSNYYNLHVTPYFVEGQIVLKDTIVFDVKTREVVERLEITKDTFSGISPSWSPEGEIVFYSANASSRGIYYLENINGTAQRLTFAQAPGDYYPSWSPDGEQIVFSRRWYDDIQDGLWIISKDSSKLKRLIAVIKDSRNIERAVWSPDGKTIAYEGPKEDTPYFAFELWTVDVDNPEPRQLTNFPRLWNAWGPVWSPDSQQIAFTKAPGGMTGSQSNVYIIDAEGGEPRQLTSEGYTNLVPLWLSLDADEILAKGDTPLRDPPTPTPRPIPQPQPTPEPVKATNCPTPGVQITSPAEGSRFTQRNNFIVGTANIPRFHHWRIEYATDLNGGWNYLLEKDYPVDNEKLVMIDASTIPNGPYGLRLTVVDETGNYPEPCEIWFTNEY